MEIGGASDGTEAPDALPGLALDDGALAIDGAALVSEDVAANVAGNAGDVKIDATNFPAKAFRNYVKANFDTDGNGALSKAERDAVTAIALRTYADWEDDINKVSCANLKGIGFFPNLISLEAVNCGLSQLDVTGNKKLETLACAGNKLSSLNLSKNKALKQLYCSENKLSKLDLTGNPKLEELECTDNRLALLDVSKCKALKVLHAWHSQLKKLDVTKNAKLEQLRVFGNQLTALDISKNPKLTQLNCSENRIQALDVSKNTKLFQLNANSNKLTALDISRNPKLKYLYTNGNAIKTIDLKKNKILRGYLKNKMWEEDDGVYWSCEGEDDLWGLGIDYATTLTNGSKVLYQGR